MADVQAKDWRLRRDLMPAEIEDITAKIKREWLHLTEEGVGGSGGAVLKLAEGAALAANAIPVLIGIIEQQKEAQGGR